MELNVINCCLYNEGYLADKLKEEGFIVQEKDTGIDGGKWEQTGKRE